MVLSVIKITLLVLSKISWPNSTKSRYIIPHKYLSLKFASVEVDDRHFLAIISGESTISRISRSNLPKCYCICPSLAISCYSRWSCYFWKSYKWPQHPCYVSLGCCSIPTGIMLWYGVEELRSLGYVDRYCFNRSLLVIESLLSHWRVIFWCHLICYGIVIYDVKFYKTFLSSHQYSTQFLFFFRKILCRLHLFLLRNSHNILHITY